MYNSGHFVFCGVREPRSGQWGQGRWHYVYNTRRTFPQEWRCWWPETGAPYAVIDATATSMRTGAVTAVGAKYLAKKEKTKSGASRRVAELHFGTLSWVSLIR